GLSGKEWCEKFGVELCATREEVVEKSDVLVVLSPDNAEEHERLGKEALMSGKRVYMDKTFAEDSAAAKRMFELAEANGTTLCSSSALRFSRNLDKLAGDKGIVNFATTGPGIIRNYSVHQLEMIVKVMGVGAKRVLVTGTENAHNVMIDYGKDRYATMSQAPMYDFSCAVTWEDGQGEMVIPTDFFPNFIHDMLAFFAGGEPIAPKAETIEIMTLIETITKAAKKPGTWLKVEA
ncbi:MAG: Gfo/Idh/MocA family oxidoreductase, partial [Clostridia bacterium]|nr:Gfo/Idh/MocA family oxidoreductase [Clostridia bacterium]